MNSINKLWILFCVCSFAYLMFKTFDYSNYLRRTPKPIDSKFMNITLLACYKLELKKTNCSVSSDETASKRNFSCLFKEPIACYTKGFNEKSPKEIIRLFNECNLQNLTDIALTDKGQRNDKTNSLIDNRKLILFFDQICVRSLFHFRVRNGNKAFFAFTAKHALPYSVKASIDYESEFVRSTDLIPIFKRFCYLNRRRVYVCNMANYESTITINVYNFQKIKARYVTDCSDYNGKNRMQLIWSCVRNKTLNYDLVYDAKTDATLSFANSLPTYLECLHLFSSPPCDQVELKKELSTDWKPKARLHENEFKLYVESKQSRTKFSLQLNRLIFHWPALFCALFGINLTGLISSALNCLLTFSKPLSKYRTILISCFVLLSTSLILSLQVSQILQYDFQTGSNRQIQKPMMENDNLTIYICFEEKHIMKNSDRCFSTGNKTCTLRQKMNALWTRTDLCNNVEVLVQGEYIVFEESDLTEYYFRSQKCFKYNFRQPTLIYFAALMRNVLLEIRFNVPYHQVHVLPEDVPIELETEKSNFLVYSKSINHLAEKCVEDPVKEFNCTGYIDCRDRCIANAYAKHERLLPIYLGINPEMLSNDSYLDLPIEKINKRNGRRLTAFERFPQCNIRKFRKCVEIELVTVTTKVANNRLIQLNLNPDLKINEKIQKYSLFAVLVEQQLPIILIWMNFSISTFIKSSTVFIERRFHNAKNMGKITRVIVLIVFLISFKVLLDLTVYQDLKVRTYYDVAREVSLPKLQFCIELEEDVDLKTGDELEQRTPNLTNLFVEMYLLRDDLSFENLLDRAPCLAKLMKTFYFRNSKCIEVNLQDFQVQSDTVKLKVASSVLDITLTNVATKQLNAFIQAYNFVNFNRAIPIKPNTFYTISYTTVRMIRNDKFLFLKNPSIFIDFLLNKNIRNEQHDYFRYLLDTFYAETRLTTTHLPIDRPYFHVKIDNRQFLDFIKLRTLSSVLNDWLFDANSDSEFYLFDYTMEQLENNAQVNRRNLSSIALQPNLIVDYYVEESKFGVLTVSHCLIGLIVFWFNLNLTNLPTFLGGSLQLVVQCAKCLVNIIIWLLCSLRDRYQRVLNFLQCRDVIF